MSKLNEYEKFKVLRPILEDVELDYNKMPIIKKFTIKDYERRKIQVTNFKNVKSIKEEDITIVDMFNYDYVLESLWNNPFKYVLRFQRYLAVASPDYSIYSTMNKFEIEHNVFKNRWVGATWQSLGVKVIPTISWCNPDTYDLCFSGIEPGGCVIISTLGVNDNLQVFLDGFNEMKKRIFPQLIVVIGKLINGMEGNFLLYRLTETFNPHKNVKQLALFDLTNFLSVKEGVRYYGE